MKYPGLAPDAENRHRSTPALQQTTLESFSLDKDSVANDDIFDGKYR